MNAKELNDFVDFLNGNVEENNKSTIKNNEVNDAWELAYKIMFIDKIGGFTSKEFNEIFGGLSRVEVMKLGYECAKEFIKEYEKKKLISIGDIVVSKDGSKYLVLGEEVVSNGTRVLHTFSENGHVEFIKSTLLSKIGNSNFVNTMLKSLNCSCLR